MSNSDASRLMSRDEGPHLEHRPTFEPDDVRHVAAFLNSGGGSLVFGVRPDGDAVGVKQPGRVVSQIEKALGAMIRPRPQVSIRRLPLPGGHELVVVDAPVGVDGPYVFGDAIVVRDGGLSRDARPEEITGVIQAAAHRKVRWETQPALGVELGNLNEAEITKTARLAQGHRFVKLGSEPKEILDSLQLLANGQVSNAAVVLFAQNPARWLPQTRVRVARFEGRGTSSASDQRVLEGNLFELLDQLEDFLRRHLAIRTEKPSKGYQREEQASVPQPVVREAILNALAHRDYAAYTGGVRLGVWDDHLELWNSGALPEELSLAELTQQHASRPRNPNIAHVLFLRQLVEGYGTGTELIAERLDRVGLPPPRWEMFSGGTALTIRFAVGGSLVDMLPRERRLLERMSAGDVIRAKAYEVEVAAEVTSRQARADLRKLVHEGYLERAGQGRATRYVRTGKRLD